MLQTYILIFLLLSFEAQAAKAFPQINVLQGNDISTDTNFYKEDLKELENYTTDIVEAANVYSEDIGE